MTDERPCHRMGAPGTKNAGPKPRVGREVDESYCGRMVVGSLLLLSSTEP
jgi:hypothetical protein